MILIYGNSAFSYSTILLEAHVNIQKNILNYLIIYKQIRNQLKSLLEIWREEIWNYLLLFEEIEN